MTIERQQYVADHQARARGRAVVGHADNQQTLLLFAPTALRVGKADRLTREAEISAFRPAVCENSGGRWPRDRGRNHNPEAADGRSRRDPDQPPDESTKAPPANPSCIGAVVRMT